MLSWYSDAQWMSKYSLPTWVFTWQYLTAPYGLFPGGSVIKNPPADAEDTGDMEKEMATH